MEARSMKDDEVFHPRSIPCWVKDLVVKHNGTDVRFLMAKTLSKSDVNQNRLILPSNFVDANMIPALSEPEKAAANLLHPRKKQSEPDNGVHGLIREPLKKKRKRAKKYGGLEVMMFTQSQWKFFVEFTHWDSSNATVLKGKELKYILNHNSLHLEDEVELWSFRCGADGRLRFALAKKEMKS